MTLLPPLTVKKRWKQLQHRNVNVVRNSCNWRTHMKSMTHFMESNFPKNIPNFWPNKFNKIRRNFDLHSHNLIFLNLVIGTLVNRIQCSYTYVIKRCSALFRCSLRYELKLLISFLFSFQICISLSISISRGREKNAKYFVVKLNPLEPREN